jgi:hypothetical protein
MKMPGRDYLAKNGLSVVRNAGIFFPEAFCMTENCFYGKNDFLSCYDHHFSGNFI